MRIVGIGASAGGLEAVTELLVKLPADTGMSFVVVQHLDPSRESLLPELLQKATAMPVLAAKQAVVVRPNRVYVIPPNAGLTISRGRLRLTRRKARPLPMAINDFLYSLASDQGEDSISVILSGTASDGAQGVRAVKAAGGIVFAQDEQTAGQPGMPHNAALTGCVDFILSPAEIARELARLAERPFQPPQLSAVSRDAESLRRILRKVRQTTGVDFANYKQTTIGRRMLRRLALHKMDSLARYAKLVEADPDEARALHDDMLIHVTQFFRDPAAFKALRAKAFPRLLKSGDGPIRVWVAGCSTGEEAYSIAILLLDYLGERNSGRAVQIFATDINEAELDRARAGVYSAEIANDVPERFLRRFFTKLETGGYEVAKRVRDLCIFAKHDLTRDPPFAGLDLLSCRNVLIYLGPEIHRTVLPVFHYALKPSGVLFLGSAEGVGDSSSLFDPLDKLHRLFLKKPGPSNAHFAYASRFVAAPGAEGAKKRGPGALLPETDVQKVADRILLQRFAPAGLIVSKNLSILHFRGQVSPYLEPAAGRASLELLKMVPDAHAGVIRRLVAKAAKEQEAVRESGLGARRKLTIEVIPFVLPLSGDRYFIVLFEEGPGAAGAPARPETQRLETPSVKRLKTELSSMRTYLQTVVEEHEAANEELKAANEEIISSNEELQSTNEELEIAKEELQAANEELTTLNEELHHRNTDLGQLNNDLFNLLSSVHLPIVMVGNDLRIRRFTPMAERVMNLIPGDVGRLITDVKPKLELPNIEGVILDVIETMTPKELRITGPQGTVYSLRVRPYRTTDNKVDGAVLVFVAEARSPKSL